ERFRRAFDDAAIGMALVTLDGKFLQVNLALCEITGYNEAELVGSFFQDITHPEDLNADLEYIRQALAGECRSYQMEMRYIHKSGHLVWGLLGVSVVKDQGGNSLYFVAQIQDISERHKIDRIKDEFISIISHELRTPLTAIRGSLGILETGVLDNRPEKAKYMLQLAVNNSDRLVRLVNDILDLERLQSGKVELVMEMCQIEDLMQQSVESVQVIANQADVKLELIPLVAEVWASPDAIVQALTNLLSNAIKFSPANSTIWLSAELRNSEPGTEENQTVSHSPLSSSYILFQVKDQGRGIPADKLEAIFGRFQQVDISDARQKGGTGLGLAICKSIVQQHGGKIWAQSTLGEGSVFYFTLPITSREV
ncbi:MAG TPA: PAS domain S-box protein, partial [Phormidium sp.]